MHSIEEVVFSYQTIWLLKIVIAIFAIALASLFLGLGAHKQRIIRLGIRKKSLSSVYFDQIASICSGTPLPLTQPADFHEATCLCAACALHRSRASNCPAAQQAIDSSTAIELLKSGLSSSDWGRRYQALDAMAELRTPSLYEYLIEFTRAEENFRVFSHGLYACAVSLSTPQHFREISKLIQARPILSASYDEGALRLAIRSLRQACGDQLAHAEVAACLDSGEFGTQYKASLINAIGKEQFRSLQPLVSACARQNAERIVAISTMRALANLGVCDELITANLSSPDPVLQLVAIRACSCCDPSVAEKIAQHLSSPDFDVRYAAATTLCTFPNGHALLQQASQHPDRYARDMANFALALG